LLLLSLSFSLSLFLSFFLSFSFFSLIFSHSDSKGTLALKFLTPALIISGDDVFFVHQLKQWSKIEVGWNETHIRFGLRKLALPKLKEEEDQLVEIVPQVFLQFEIPADHQILERFENEEFKGVKLKLIQVKASGKDDFNMF